jgi:hypothetical protein
VSLSISSPVCL